MKFMQSSTSHLFLLSSTLPSYHIFFFASIFPSIYFVSSPIYFVLHCIFAICQNRYLQRLLFPGTDGSTILSNISNNIFTLNSLIMYCILLSHWSCSDSNSSDSSSKSTWKGSIIVRYRLCQVLFDSFYFISYHFVTSHIIQFHLESFFHIFLQFCRV